MKTVIIFCNSSWNIYNFRKKLISELKKKFKVIIISGKDEYSDKVKHFTKSYFLSLENRSVNPFIIIKEILNLKKIINNYQDATIINFTNKSIILASIAVFFKKIRLINVVTGLGHTYLHKSIIIKFLIKSLYILVNFRSDLIIVQNKYDKKYFQNQLFTHKKIKLIHGSGVDTKKFYPSSKVKKKKENIFIFWKGIKRKRYI